jgi:hypothetical protein
MGLEHTVDTGFRDKIAFLLIPFLTCIKRGTGDIELSESPSHAEVRVFDHADDLLFLRLRVLHIAVYPYSKPFKYDPDLFLGGTLTVASFA